jgi:hypothetical protein
VLNQAPYHEYIRGTGGIAPCVLNLGTTYIHTYIPWILKFVMATIGCGISHKDT